MQKNLFIIMNKIINMKNLKQQIKFVIKIKKIQLKSKTKEIFSFWNFIIYKLSFGKKYNNLRIYEVFREKVISVENLTRNHLNILNLLKLNKIKKVS